MKFSKEEAKVYIDQTFGDMDGPFTLIGYASPLSGNLIKVEFPTYSDDLRDLWRAFKNETTDEYDLLIQMGDDDPEKSAPMRTLRSTILDALFEAE